MKNKNYLSGTFNFKTDIGKVRLSNEDRANALVNSRGNVFLIVCDGMGGQNKGEFAAEIGMTFLCEAFQKKARFAGPLFTRAWLNNVIAKANKEIYNESLKDARYKGMGCTLTCALITSDYCYIAQIGDSRAYTLDKNDHIKQITEDQTLVDYLYRTGKIAKEDMATHPQRHVLMNALGIFPTVDVEIFHMPYKNEPLLLCSDGLFNNVRESDIENILRKRDSVMQKTNELISLANANGGSDNIAISIWEANK